MSASSVRIAEMPHKHGIGNNLFTKKNLIYSFIYIYIFFF